jgi:hypothetical protein
MQVKEHPYFEAEYRQTTKSSYLVISILIAGTIAALYLGSIIPIALVFVVGITFGLSVSSKIKVMLEKQICPECNKAATLIIPKRYGWNYFSECIQCQVRWDLKVKHLPND